MYYDPLILVFSIVIALILHDCLTIVYRYIATSDDDKKKDGWSV